MLTLLLAGAMALRAFAAEELDFRKNVGDFWIYLAVMPADLIAGLPAAEPGATPFQLGSARDTHHLMALFDCRAGRRIKDAVLRSMCASSVPTKG